VSGPAEAAETDFGNFRNFRKRYANQGAQSPAWRLLSSRRSRPVGSRRNKTNFCVPLPGSEITDTGNKAFSNRSIRRSVQAMPADLNGRFLAFLTLLS
jgi:hypothetical protein